MSVVNETFPPAVMEAIANGDTTALLIEVYKATSHTAGQVLEHNKAIGGLQKDRDDHAEELSVLKRRVRKIEDLFESRRSSEPLLNAAQRAEAEAIMSALRKISEDAAARDESSKNVALATMQSAEKAELSAKKNASLATLRTLIMLLVFALIAWLKNR